jgi:hypothetical protein
MYLALLKTIISVLVPNLVKSLDVKFGQFITFLSTVLVSSVSIATDKDKNDREQFKAYFKNNAESFIRSVIGVLTYVAELLIKDKDRLLLILTMLDTLAAMFISTVHTQDDATLDQNKAYEDKLTEITAGRLS